MTLPVSDGWGVLFALLLHASALLVVAALLLLVLRRPARRNEELIWRTALFGALLTVPLQGMLPGAPSPAASGTEARARAPRLAAATAEEDPKGSRLTRTEVHVLGETEQGWTVLEGRSTFVAEPRLPETRLPPLSEVASAPSGDTEPFDGAHLGWSWLVGAALLLFRQALARRRFAKRLGGLRPVEDAGLLERFVSLRRRARAPRATRLYVGLGVRTPLSLCWPKPRVVVPACAFTELDDEEIEALLAHELAHLRRRDGLWMALEGIARACLFFHPLAHLASRRLRQLAELDADRRAVKVTGRPEALASCLTTVASWLIGKRRPLPVPAMAEGRSLLGRRVRHLLDGPGAPRCAPLRAALPAVAALGLVAGLGPRLEAAPLEAEAAPTRAPAAAPTELRWERDLPEPSVRVEIVPRPGSPRSAPRVRAALSTLDRELLALEAELRSLREQIEATQQLETATPLLERIEGHLKALRARRERLRGHTDTEEAR